VGQVTIKLLRLGCYTLIVYSIFHLHLRGLYSFEIMTVEALVSSLVHIAVRRSIWKLCKLIDSYVSWTLNIFEIVSFFFQIRMLNFNVVILSIFIISFIVVHCSSSSTYQTLYVATYAMILYCASLSV